MEDSDHHFEDYHDEEAPQFTKILDLTNGEGGERRAVAAPPPARKVGKPQHAAAATAEEHAAGVAPEEMYMDEDDDDMGEAESDEAMAMARGGVEPHPPPVHSSSTKSNSAKSATGSKIALMNPHTPGKVVESGQEQTGRWTKQEHEAFLEALRMYGKEWKKVAAKVKTRTVVQTRTHAQKYFQKLQKAQEAADPSRLGPAAADIDFVDMGTTADSSTSSSKRGQGSGKKKQRNQSAAAATAGGGLPAVAKTNRRSSNTTISAAQVISGLSSAGAGAASHPFAGGGRPPRPQHGFSTDDAAPFASAAPPAGWASSASHAAAAATVTSMKIIAPDPMATIKKGKFPEPSPAATGKRKLAEIAAAQMLAGVAGAVPKDGASDVMDDRGEGAATPPLPDTETSGLNMKDAPLPPLFGGDSSLVAGGGLSLQIVNPESLGVTSEKRRKVGDGGDSPVTPWDGQLEALVNEKAKTKSADDELIDAVVSGNLGSLDTSPANGHASERTYHAVCGPGTMFGRSPLHCAVCEMDIESLQTQLAEVANRSDGVLARLDNAGFAPLHTAASLRMTHEDHAVAALEMVRTLLSAGADPNVADEKGNSPLHWAARAGDRDVAEFLLVRNSQLDAKNKVGETALHWAMRAGHVGVGVVALLVDHGARISNLNNKFRRPIEVAAEGFFDDETSIAALKAKGLNEGKKTSRELKKKLREKLDEIRASRHHLFVRSVPSRTLVLHHDECLEHVPKSQSDWEAPDRVLSILSRISRADQVSEEIRNHEVALSSEFERANLDLLSRVHSTDYLHFVQNLSKDLEKQVKAASSSGATGTAGDDEGGDGQSPPVVPFTPMVQRTMIKVSESLVKSAPNSDTAFSAGSLRAARRAAGAVQHAVDCVLVGRSRNSFCVVRPPGHHAGVSGLLDGGESCGFCIFNNVAAGALYAISDERLLCDRCAIVDIDVHHGNGTEEIVRKCQDPSKLFFFSIHLYDNDKKKRNTNQYYYKFYPGTGAEDDLAMNIINVPIEPLWKEQLAPSPPVTRTHNTRQKARSSDQDEESPVETPRGSGRGSDAGSETGSANNASPRQPKAPPGPGSGRLAYRDAIQSRLLPALRAFNPDLILISAGFDAAKGDVGNARHERGGRERVGLDLEPEDYAWTTRKILEIADICCNGRVVSVLEGGYGRSPANSPPADDSASAKPLDRTIFSECAVRHLHALIDPYDVECRFASGQ